MRLPYIQVSQETWDHARSLSALTGVDLGRAFMALCDLYRWGLSLGPADEAPTGVCASPRADRLLAAALGWEGDCAELVVALIDLGLLEQLVDVGLRVRGTDRYAEAFERQVANRERWRRNNERRRKPAKPRDDSERPRVDRAVTARSQRGLSAIDADADADADAVPPSEVGAAPPAPATTTPPPPVEPPPAPRHRPIIADRDGPTDAAWWAWAQQARVEALGVVRERPPRGLGAWWSVALGELGGDTGRLSAAWEAYLRDPHWRGATPSCPWAGWVSQWERFVPRAPVHAAATTPEAEAAREVLGEYLASTLSDDDVVLAGQMLVITTSDEYRAHWLRGEALLPERLEVHVTGAQGADGMRSARDTGSA